MAPSAAAPATDSDSPSQAELMLADLMLKGGTFLLRQGIGKGLLGRALPQGKAAGKGRRQGLGSSLMHGLVLRLATRSVPAAILVSGALLAKSLHDRRKKAALGNSRPAPSAPDGDDSGKQT
ncbi:MAG: hypothetical protein N2423_06875 [Novosphingobium sp.]|nr:hypothetical protein [Novosphingobium sp.]